MYLFEVFSGVSIYLILTGGVYGVFWYIYSWFTSQVLNVFIHGLVSAIIFVPVVVIYVWTDPRLGTDSLWLVIPCLMLLTLLMTRPVMHGSKAIWLKIKE